MIQTRFSDAISLRFRRIIPSGSRSRVGHLMALGVVVLMLPAGCGRRPPDRVLLVSIDTLRADHVGCYGATRAHTPQMDEIGARGVRFAATLSPAPLTLPAHVSLMTALDPPAHGVRHNSIHRLNESIPTLAERMREAGFATAAFVGAVVLDPRFGLARGFDHYDDRMESRVSGLVGYAERRADRVVDAALAWVRQAPPRFFLWVHLYDPHASYDPPPGFASAFASRPYDGEIAFADAELGRLLTGIRGRWGESGLLVVVTSDHGESLGEHAEPTHTYTIYDATQRVPLLMSGPGLAAGRVIEAPVRLIDVAPTLLGLAGAAPLAGVAGKDLRPVIAGSEGEERIAYMETLATQIDFRWSPLLGLRTGRFKYIRAPRPELYDLVADPGETINRADDEPDRVAALDLQLSALLEGMAAMAGAHSPGAVVELSELDRERLRSLGYLARDSGIEAADLGKIGGPNPKDSMGILGSIARAQGLLGEGRAAEALAELDSLEHPGAAIDAMRA
ncbi:MAG: sulfatase, partial [Myxococcota bacterium]